MEEGVPENDNWDGDSHVSQLPLPQISFQKLCHIIHWEPPGFQLKGKSQTSRAQTTAALLWLLSTINSFLPERSPTLNSWKRITTEPRKELEAYPAQGLSLISHIKCASCLLRSLSESLGTAMVTDTPSNKWTWEVTHLSDIKRPAMEEKQKRHRWSCLFKSLWMSWD